MTHPENDTHSHQEPSTEDNGPDTTVTDDKATQEPTDPSKREAALRQRVKTAETGLSASQSVVERLQHAEVLRLAATHLANGDDLLTVHGAKVADLLADDESGTVDPAKVETAAGELITARGEHFRAGYRTQRQHGAGGHGHGQASGNKTGGQLLTESLADKGHPAYDRSEFAKTGTHRY